LRLGTCLLSNPDIGRHSPNIIGYLFLRAEAKNTWCTWRKAIPAARLSGIGEGARTLVFLPLIAEFFFPAEDSPAFTTCIHTKCGNYQSFAIVYR
jgi:hypothetical protein